ncbi:MAG: ATP-binding cassette domain-containing protein [Clostridia bacterium]|nr:ATP-binding cassette domain-containing protein [Clostridia bacterium]
MIKVQNLVKRYGTNYAVNDISFEIGEGEIVGLLGPNGAGKSTTMNILTGYLAATSGEVTVGGFDISKEPIAAKRMIGFLPEQPPLYPDMTVKEYLNFVYDLKGCKLPREEHLSEIISVVRLNELTGRLIKNLSKGNKQRVGIAEALIGDPKVIIFDEPTIGLDPKQVIAVRNLMRTLAKRHTVILSTHVLAEVQTVCERVIIINKGKIIADEKTENIVKTIEDGYRYRVKVCGPQKEAEGALSRLVGVKSVVSTGDRDLDSYAYVIESDRGVDIRKAVFNLCSSRNWAILGMEPVGTDLESVFIRLVDRSDGIAPEKNKKRRERREDK